MNVILNTRSIRSALITPKTEVQLFPTTDTNLSNKGHEVDRYPMGIFSNPSREMGSTGIMILFHKFGLEACATILQYKEFGLAVRVGRLHFCRLGDGQLFGIAVANGETTNLEISCCSKACTSTSSLRYCNKPMYWITRPSHIVISLGIGFRFTHGLEKGKMRARGKVRKFLQLLLQGVAISNVARAGYQHVFNIAVVAHLVLAICFRRQLLFRGSHQFVASGEESSKLLTNIPHCIDWSTTFPKQVWDPM